VLARADALAQSTTLDAGTPLLARLYRRFVDRPGERRLLESDAPIYDRDHAAVIGRLEVTQTADRWIRLRDRALTRMLNFTVSTSLVAVIAMFAFAAWLALRLERLRRASESALTRSGIETRFPETEARDELGDVARGFSTLLSRLNEYTSYLRTLAGKLAHEIRATDQPDQTSRTVDDRHALEALSDEQGPHPVPVRVGGPQAVSESRSLHQLVDAIGSEDLHLRLEPRASDRLHQLRVLVLAAEHLAGRVTHRGEDDRARVDDRTVEIEEDDGEAHHGAIVTTASAAAFGFYLQVGNRNDPMRVRQVPITTVSSAGYSCVYQKVQSSVGSTAIML